MRNIAFQHAHAVADSNKYRISQLMSFTAERLPSVDSTSRPFCVRFKGPLRGRRQHYGFTASYDTLQHSIRSLWLRATPAEIAPACHQTIASPHVLFIMTTSEPQRLASVIQKETRSSSRPYIELFLLIKRYAVVKPDCDDGSWCMGQNTDSDDDQQCPRKDHARDPSSWV